MISKVKQILTTVFVFLTISSYALEIYSVKAIPPENVYIGEPFEIIVEIEASRNADISFGNITKIPPDLKLNGIRPLSITEKNTGTQKIVVQRYVIDANAEKSGEYSIVSSKITMEITIPIQSFFGNMTQTVKQTRNLEWLPFEVKALPEEGRPADFSGALGKFTLEAELSPEELMAGDIAKLTLTLKGKGYTNGAELLLPPLNKSQFKIYPGEQLPTAKGELMKISANIIPLSTNSAVIPSAGFSYFDTKSGSYKTAESDPISIRFMTRRKVEPEMRTIDINGKGKISTVNTSDKTIQLYIAPNKSSLPTYQYQEGDTYEVIETLKDNSWIRIRMKNGETGWLPPR